VRVVDEGLTEHAEEALIDLAMRGGLSADDQARLERHLAACASCRAELEALRVFDLSLAPAPEDEALDRAAVEHAMTRLGQRETFGAAVVPRLQDEALDRLAVERAMGRLGDRGTFRSRLRRWLRPATGVATFGFAAGIAIAFAVFQGRRPPKPVASVSAVRPFILSDGSEIAPDDPATAIQVSEQTPARTIVHLPSGGARFHVRHDGRRLFCVDAGSIEIQDIGTVFRVAHEPGGLVRVTVSEGRVAVRVAANDLRVELGAGDDRVFGAAAETPGEPEPAREAPETSAPVAAQGKAPARGQPRARVVDDPAQLLLAADVARRSGEPRGAVNSLRRLVEHYPKDPRAPSAAFTLGWVLLTDLNRPREAAVAFADAERIAPRGALAEDAAARVAEAWQKAGDQRRAADAARHYAQVYPAGRYAALMRALIGER
jgi:transmembrane sensor